jgi:hypothetical protein
MYLELRMKDLKKFVMNEIKNAIIEEKNRINKKKLDRALYETVNATSKLKKKIAETKDKKELIQLNKKYGQIKSLTKLIENKIKETNKWGNHNEGEGVMMKAQLRSIIDHANRLYHMIDESDVFEDWLQYKVTIAEDYLRAASGYIKYFNTVNGDDKMNGNKKYDDDDDYEYDDEDLDDWDEVEEDELDYEFDDNDGYDYDDDGFDFNEGEEKEDEEETDND